MKACKLHLTKEDEGKVIKLDEDTELCFIIEKGKDEKKIQIIKAPEIHLKKAVKFPMPYTVKLEKGKKALCIDPYVGICAFPHLGLLSLSHLQTEHKELRERLEELRDKLEKFKESKVEKEIDKDVEEALEAVEETLEEMRKELEKLPKELDDIHIDIKTDLKHELLNKVKDLKTLKDHVICIKRAGGKKIAYVTDKEGGFQIIIKNKLDSEGKAKHEEILKELKESLPECYEVESEIDEENNTLTIKITCKKKDEKSEKEVKELAMKIFEKLKKVEKI